MVGQVVHRLVDLLGRLVGSPLDLVGGGHGHPQGRAGHHAGRHPMINFPPPELQFDIRIAPSTRPAYVPGRVLLFFPEIRKNPLLNPVDSAIIYVWQK